MPEPQALVFEGHTLNAGRGSHADVKNADATVPSPGRGAPGALTALGDAQVAIADLRSAGDRRGGQHE